MKTKILFLFLFTLISNIYSQNDSVASVDHSKVTLSTDIIPQWKVQMEVGGTSWYSEDTKNYDEGTPWEYFFTRYDLSMDLPSLTFRIGIFKNIEARVAGVFKQEFHITESNSLLIWDQRTGYYSGGPIEAGVKIKLFEESSLVPSTAIKADLFIPAGDYYFHMDYVSPVFRLMLQKHVSKNFSVGANAGYGWNVYDYFTDKYGNYSVSLNVNVSKKLGAFAEAFSYFQHRRTPDHRLGAGLSYSFAKNVMAVVQGGFGISERAPDIFGSGGIGFMFP
ncbi:MAG TPA: transporter [Ignavibacteria bacterium]|nr:transporter [Ignavibacteria bacterium]HMQ99999.1 transporter [Ignavibacteria bacterium]